MPAPGSPLHVTKSNDVTVVTFRDRVLLDTEELNIIEADILKFDLGKIIKNSLFHDNKMI